MRIATWNIDRLKQKNKLDMIQRACNDKKADILVLTETDERVAPDYRFVYRISSLRGVKIPMRYKGGMPPVNYADTENRVSIFTNYHCLGEYPTFNRSIAICIELGTEFGNILVYGTIMGLFGNREASFKTDLIKQMEDIKHLTAAGHNVCVAGDYNLSFSDNYYHTTLGRETVHNCFSDAGISILTSERPECIDHIAISDRFMAGHRVTGIDEWNIDKKLSDHKGVIVGIN